MVTTRIQKYVDRLVKEWNEHFKIILAVDFDSTLSYWPTIDNPNDIYRTIKLIRECQATGCYVVIHTASDPNRHEEILNYCERNGIVVATINETPLSLPYGKSGSKIFYNHQLCDRSGLLEALDILEKALYLRREQIQYSKPVTEIG